MTDRPARRRLLDPEFIARLEKLDFVVRRMLVGEARGEVLTRRRGPGLLFREHKRYVQGDDLRFLDWNVYSRLGELLVKEFEAEESLALHLFVDSSASMDFGRENKFERALEVAAALGYVALRRHGGVEIVSLADEAPPRRFFGRRRVEAMLHDLAGLRAHDRFDLDRKLRRVAASGRRRGVACVLSDFFDEAGYAEGLKFLRHAGYQVAAIQILDPLDLRPDVKGRCRLLDVESERDLRLTISDDLLRAYEKEASALCDGLRRFCARYEMSYARLDTTWSLERSVRSLLGGGGVLR